MTKKWYSKKFRGRAAVACAAVLALTSSFGLLAGCSEDDDTDTTKTSSNPDSQVIKNGNFEFYDDNDGTYLISSPTNWSSSSLGTSSYVMSGVINTKSSKWAALTDEALAEKLDYNNELADNYDDDPDTYESEYEENYVDYNGMHSYDIPYVDVASAIEYLDADEDDETDETAVETIANPETHNEILSDSTGYYYTDENGDRVDLYVPEVETDDDGTYYLDEDEEKVYLGTDDSGNVIYDYFLDADCTEAYESSVLMVHNYLKNGNGTGQYYASSTTVTLEANTAAEISVWVKTSDLYYNNYTAVTQNRGAFIEVEQTVGGTTLDSFSIKYINTEKLNTTGENNGWVQYTIYIQACDYADTTVTISLGLGADGAGAVEGYAFFDDLVCTKYSSIEETSLYEAADDGLIYSTKDSEGNYSFSTKAESTDSTTCTLLSEGNEKIFEADSTTYTTESGAQDDDRYSNNYYYYIDLTASGSRGTITLSNGDTITIATTKDDDDYVVGDDFDKTTLVNLSLTDWGTATEDYYVNSKLSAINADSDILALLNITDDDTVSTALSGSSYASLMSEQLTSAKDLPQATSDTKTLLILSAMGTPYTATVTEASGANFTIDADSYYIISIWVKTSDMNGATAATLNLVDVDDEDNTATIAIDTTGTTTDITDNNGDTTEDIYDGWVQCFFYIQNDTEETKQYYLELQFGESTIKGTSVSAYSGGWAAFTNITTLEVDETEFGYAGSGDNTATLTFSDEDNRSSNYFDTASSETDIENDLTKPSNYTGVNGASSAIISSDDGISSYDYQNTNAYAGLLNTDYLENYIENDLSWAKALLAGTTYTSTSEAVANLQDIFGNAVQPLLIVNTIRTYADNKTSEVTSQSDIDLGIYYTYDESSDSYKLATTYDSEETYYTLKQVLNYGYMGEETTLSTETYTAITVKVKVSGSTSAYIYLTDTTADRDVLSYETPDYTFWYDTDGNVLKTEPDEDDKNYDATENIAYTLRTDGLYEDENGDLYANLYNYTKTYYDESESYYDEDGNMVSFDDVVDGETYYTSASKTAYSKHRLTTDDGTRVFEYTGTGVGTAAVYYYYIAYEEDDTTYYAYDTDYEVKTFDTSVAEPRYYGADAGDTAYCFVVGDTNGEWATVNFLIYTGSESKSYRLELWSGSRELTGVDVLNTESDGSIKSVTETGGYVIFDYSYLSLDESTYTSLLEEYTDDLIAEYRSRLLAKGVTIKSNDENLDYYKKLAEENNIDCSDLESKYYAYYYTFTLYDSAAYYPFNEETAGDDDTGYDYSIDDYEETLAYFKYSDASTNTYTMFIDYSAVDQSIDRVEASTDEDEDEDEDSDTNVWLLISSIVLVVALVLTLIAMIVRELTRKISRKRHSKRLARNVYTKRKRYIRQYTKANGEIDLDEGSDEVDETYNEIDIEPDDGEQD